MTRRLRFIGGVTCRFLPVVISWPLAELRIEGALITIRLRSLLRFFSKRRRFEASEVSVVKHRHKALFEFVLRDGNRAYFATFKDG